MKRILHLADLHFGRAHPHAVESIYQFLSDQGKEIDLAVITGDWTQRARVEEFEAAREFVEKFGKKVVSLPGNHDVPLYNLWQRWLTPLERYRQHLEPVTQSAHHDPEVAVFGLHTVNPWVVADGRVSSAEISRAQNFFSTAAPEAVRIVGTHHPIFGKQPLENGTKVLETLRPHVVLSGHAHREGAELIVNPDGSQTLHVVSGSSASNRLRGEENSFHLLEVERGRIAVKTFFLKDTGFAYLEKKGRVFAIASH